MADIQYKIDKSRPNGFYRYTKLVDNIAVDKGWGLYTRLSTKEERDAWLKGISEYNKANNIQTESDKIKRYTQQIREKLAQKPIYGDKKPLVMPSVASVLTLLKAANPEDACDDTFLQKILEPMGGEIPTPKAMFEYAWKAELYNIKVDIDNARVMFINLGVNAFVTPVLDLCDETVDMYFGTISLIKTEVERICAKALYYYNRYKEITDTSEEGKKRKEEYLNRLKAELVKLGEQYGKEIINLLYTLLCIDQIKSMLELIRSFQRTASSTWQSLVSDIKSMLKIDLDEWLDENSKMIKAIIDNILSALAAMAGAFIAQMCSEEKCAEADKEMFADAIGTTPDKVAEVQMEKTMQAAEALSAGTVIYKYAMDNANGYSLYYNMNQLVEDTGNIETETNEFPSDSSIDCLCKVSMCEYDTPLDYKSVADGSPIKAVMGANEIIIEFDKKLNVNIVVTEGSDIELNDTIAYIGSAPVKSNANIHVIEIGSNYIIGNYITSDADLNDPSSLSNDVEKIIKDKLDSESDNVYTEVIDEYNQLARTDTFIREYISYFRYPELAQYTREHVSGNATELSTEDFIKEYEGIADDYYDAYQNAVKTTSSKENVQTYIDKNDIIGLKKEIDANRKEYYDNIINLYNSNPGNMKYCSKGRIIDFMLYDDYLNYITGDRFTYDEDNPYIVRLADAINTFLGTRQRIELNKDNIDNLIQKFNEMCDKAIKKYWTWKDVKYYDKLCELFNGDYYADTEDIVPIEKSDASITLYKRVFNYLKSISKFTKKSEDTIVYDETKDINKIIEEQSKKSAESFVDKESFELEKKLKQISFMYMSIRRIETDVKNTNVSDYIDSATMESVSSLYNSIGDTMYEYVEGETYIPLHPLFGKASILGPYIKMFKKMAAREADILRQIVKDVLEWNNKHSDRLLNGSALTGLANISWPSVGIIYHNNNKVDYYLFKEEYTDLVPADFDDLQKMITPPVSDKKFESPTYPGTGARTDRILYWLKYCGIATLMNTILPIYWGTGLVTPGGPIKLPIIYVPIYYVSGRVGFLIGLGICGVAIYPMLLFTNIGNLPGSVLVPINMAVDLAINMLKRFGSMSFDATVNLVDPMVNAFDKTITSAQKEIEDIDYQIDEIKKTRISGKVKKAYARIINSDPTFQVLEAPAYTGPEFDEELKQSNKNIDYDELLQKIDDITKEYDPAFQKFNELLAEMGYTEEEYSSAYSSDDSYVITGATDVTLTYEMFDKIYKLRNPGKTASRATYDAIVVSFNDSLKTLSNPSNYDKVADMSAYLANIMVETNFEPVREYANYSASSIQKTFTGHFDKNGNQRFNVFGQNHDITWYSSHGSDLFNYVYMIDPKTGKVGRGGNSQWGDGYKYRGGGFTQLTFKDGYNRMNTHLKTFYKKDFDLVNNPDNINKLDAAAYSMAAYWTNYGGSGNAHNVWTKSPNTAKEISGMNPSVSNMPCYNATTGGYKDFVTETEKKYIMCYKLVAGAYPADNRSETGKKTYELKGNYFKKIYKILSEGSTEA